MRKMNAESWRWYIVLKADLDSDYPEDEFEYNKKTFLLQQAGTYLLKIITSEGCQYQERFDNQVELLEFFCE